MSLLLFKTRPPQRSTLFPYTTLFRSKVTADGDRAGWSSTFEITFQHHGRDLRSEEHTSELQSRQYLVCRLLLEKKNKTSHLIRATAVPPASCTVARGWSRDTSTRPPV